jgi:hypothetical protein
MEMLPNEMVKGVLKAAAVLGVTILTPNNKYQQCRPNCIVEKISTRLLVRFKIAVNCQAKERVIEHCHLNARITKVEMENCCWSDYCSLFLEIVGTN